jgi:hypothetical protein
LGASDLQNEGLHFGLVFLEALEVVVEEKDLAGFEFLDGVQPAEVDDCFLEEDYEADAVRGGDELCLEFDHLPVDEDFWLL